MLSFVQARGAVPFPAFTAERVYMREFRKASGLPAELRRWQPTVDAMLDGVETDGPIYLMVDQGRVPAGATHRRPGVHIDGHWIPGLSAHGWRMPGLGCHGKPAPGHSLIGLSEEGLILASNVAGCVAYAGRFDGAPREGGDCSHIDLAGLRPAPMQAGRAYAGNVSMLHESVPLADDCERTLVRLNVPGWEPV